MHALWPAHRPQGLGSASETYCPVRFGPGGAFLSQLADGKDTGFHAQTNAPGRPKEGPCGEPMTLADAAKFAGQLAPSAALAPCWDYALELRLAATTTGRRKDVEAATPKWSARQRVKGGRDAPRFLLPRRKLDEVGEMICGQSLPFRSVRDY